MLKCGMLVFAFVLSGAPPAELAPAPGIAVPTAAQLKGIEAFWRTCLGKDVPGEVRVLGEPPKDGSFPSGSLAARVSGAVPKDAVEIVFSSADGTLLSYERFGGVDEPGTEGRTDKDAIPGDKAWERALPVLQYLGLPTDRDAYRIKLIDVSAQKDRQEDLYGAFWHVGGKLTYTTWECADSYVAIGISANSGDIVHVSYSPIVVPKVVHKRNVSAAEALERVRTFVTSTGLFPGMSIGIGPGPGRELEEVIARPSAPGLGLGRKGEYRDSSESFYCWQVPFRAAKGESAVLYNFYVRVDNGDVIGAL